MLPRTALALAALVYAPLSTANDFSTQARVEYVLQCMAAHGGQTYDTLYPCVCAIDRIAAMLSYEEYVQAEMLTYLLGTPGERGGVFRDAAPKSRERVSTLAEVREAAEKACFVKAR